MSKSYIVEPFLPNKSTWLIKVMNTLHMEVAIIITLPQSSIIITCFHPLEHKHFSTKSSRCLSSVGLIKIYMGYLILGAPTSEESVLAL